MKSIEKKTHTHTTHQKNVDKEFIKFTMRSRKVAYQRNRFVELKKNDKCSVSIRKYFQLIEI